MIQYNIEKFKGEYQRVYAEIDRVLNISNRFNERKIERIFMMGSGGAYTKFSSVTQYIVKNTNITQIIEYPKQFECFYADSIRETDLILLGSKTGTTQEILSVAKNLEKHKDKIIAFVGDANTPLEKHVDHCIRSYSTDVHIILLWVLILSLTKYEHLDWFIDDCKNLSTSISKDLSVVSQKANKLVEDQVASDFQMWITSGNLYGETRCFTNYMLEEIVWKKSQAVHSGEYFHGPLELVDKNTNLNVVINRDYGRDEDLRVKIFAERYSNNVYSIDMRNFKLAGINKEFHQFFDPFVLNIYFDYLLQIYGFHTGLTASTRKYYRKVDY